MDLTPLYNSLFGMLLWLIPVLVLAAVLKSAWFKGWLGELAVKVSAKLFLPKGEYHAFHNVTMPTADGTTQIDHVFVSRFGIFVVETKNMTGWIFGSEKQTQWTQKIYKQSFKFQNPLRQNFKHVKALESALDHPPEVFHSVVVFVGGSTFKTVMPVNVTHGGKLVSYIKSFSQPVLSDDQVAEAVNKIESGRLAPSLATHREHLARLKTRSDLETSQLCPNCGNQMVLRTAKQGQNAGTQFWGCSQFPRCKAVIQLQ